MKILFCVMVMLTISCSTTKISNADIDKISIDMGVLDQRLHGYIYRKKLKKDLTHINQIIYISSMNEIKEPSEIEYIEFLEKKNIDLRISGEKEDFKICVKDRDTLLVLCDRASTPFVEKIYKDKDINLDEAILEI